MFCFKFVFSKTISFSVCVLLSLVLSGLTHETELEPGSVPKIIEPEDQNELLVNSGDNFTLICKGDLPFPLKWKYENHTRESTSKLNIYNNVEKNALGLVVIGASYTDTGLYECMYDGETVSTSVYVYVKDPEHLFIPTSNHIVVVQNRNVTIPCRPTSPDVTVTLTPNETEAKEVGYDPKTGVTIMFHGLTDVGVYQCVATNDNMQTETLHILVSMLTDRKTNLRPHITQAQIGNNYVEGQTLVLKCDISFPDNAAVDLNWRFPSGSSYDSRITENVDAAQDPRTSRWGKVKILEITNLKKSDSGRYECEATDHLEQKKIVFVYINVMDKDTSYITLNTTGNVNITLTTGEQYKKIVKVAAYPQLVLLQWLHDGEEILNDAKHTVRTTNESTSLWIQEVDIKDHGVYTLRADNGKEKKELNFTLNIHAKPLVSLEGPAYVLIGKPALFSCIAGGNPVPKIDWFFKPCLMHESCEYRQLWNETSTFVEHLRVNSDFNFEEIESGVLKCKATNKKGSDENLKEVIVSDVPDGFQAKVINEGNVLDDGVIAVGDKITLSCAASKHNFTGPLQWFKIDSDNTINEIVENDLYKIRNYDAVYSKHLDVVIDKIQKIYDGRYRCTDQLNSEELKIDTKETQPPKIIKTNLNGSEIVKNFGDGLELYCYVQGVPTPTITWKKNNAKWKPDPERIQIGSNNESIAFKYTKLEDEGAYSCEIASRVGKVSRRAELVLSKPMRQYTSLMYTVIIFFLLLLIVLLYMTFHFFKMRRQKQMWKNEFRAAGLAHFENGAVESLNPELPIDDQADLLPYDKKWEFPRDKLKLGRQLGAGAFGVVMKAEAYGILQEEEATTVAVKMVKKDADITYMKALASELKIMVHLGKHLNIANLLGACTKNVSKRELLVIVEYCQFGNLHNYLLRHRADFINQVDPLTGEINTTIGADIIERAGSMSCSNRGSMSSPLIKTPSASGGPDYREEEARRAESNQACNTEMTTVSTCPEGEEGPILSNNSVQPDWRSNYRGDYRGSVRPICTKDLLCWSFQVARGMDYLASRRVLHGDLAARNILLAEDGIVKICDFGLAKSMYKDENYRKKKNSPLPIKWMAIESIGDRVFSTQSDVWSFGIVLWEFFSLAQTPYPGMVADENFYNKLNGGYRMPRPEYGTKELHEIMMHCWEARPKNRPSFGDLSDRIGKMMEDTVREHYISLNSPYLTLNDVREEGQSDYLSMMSPPNYDHFSSSGENYYINELNPKPVQAPLSPNETSPGYLLMRPSSVLYTPNSNPEKKETVFQFQSETSPKRTPPETRPMLNSSGVRSDTESDSEVSSPDFFKTPVTTQSFFNPTYQQTPAVNKFGDLVSTKDNYINLAQNKEKKLKDLVDDRLYINDPITTREPPTVI